MTNRADQNWPDEMTVTVDVIRELHELVDEVTERANVTGLPRNLVSALMNQEPEDEFERRTR